VPQVQLDERVVRHRRSVLAAIMSDYVPPNAPGLGELRALRVGAQRSAVSAGAGSVGAAWDSPCQATSPYGFTARTMYS
jgi:hypothetical protein